MLISYEQLLFYVATIFKIVRFYNIYFLGQINESVCLSFCQHKDWIYQKNLKEWYDKSVITAMDVWDNFKKLF